MKTLVLVFALLLVMGSACVADSVSLDIYAGWNMIGLPLVPFNPDPGTIFASIPSLDYKLQRWDPASGGIFYTSDAPEEFGMCLLADGYWLNNISASTITVTYDGVPDGVPDGSGNMTDMWVSLPGKGAEGAWHLIGLPYNHNIICDDGSGTGVNVKFTDGTTLKTWDEAFRATPQWVTDRMQGYNAVGGGYWVSYNGETEDDTLRAGKGYWVRTLVPNIAMILPAYPVLP